MLAQQFVNGTVQASVGGEGPTVWLFHSLLADTGSFAPLAAALSASHRVIVPDLPGFGGSAAIGPGLEPTADRMAQAMSEAGGRAAVIGNGYGSFVALTLVLRHPSLVERLVLVGTGAVFDEPGRAAFRGMAAAAEARGLAAIADTAMRRLFSPAFQDANPALLAERRERFLATDPAVVVGACHALAAMNLRGDVASVTVPTLVLVGERDEATPPAMARDLARLLPNAQFAELPNLAHVPQLQDTTAFLAAAGSFLA